MGQLMSCKEHCRFPSLTAVYFYFVMEMFKGSSYHLHAFFSLSIMSPEIMYVDRQFGYHFFFLSESKKKKKSNKIAVILK